VLDSIISTAGAQEMQKSSSRFSVVGSQFSVLSWIDEGCAGPGWRPGPGKRCSSLSSRHRGLMMGLECFQAVVDFFPVDYVPPGREVFGAAIVVFQVVGVFPDVVAENGEQALGDWVVLIGRANDLHLAARFAGEPDPAAAKLFGASVVELGLEIFEVAEGFIDDVRNRATGVAAALGLHDLPEHGVIHVPAAVVADGGADVLGDGVEIADQFLGALRLQVRIFFQSSV